MSVFRCNSLFIFLTLAWNRSRTTTLKVKEESFVYPYTYRSGFRFRLNNMLCLYCIFVFLYGFIWSVRAILWVLLQWFVQKICWLNHSNPQRQVWEQDNTNSCYQHQADNQQLAVNGHRLMLTIALDAEMVKGNLKKNKTIKQKCQLSNTTIFCQLKNYLHNSWLDLENDDRGPDVTEGVQWDGFLCNCHTQLL